ncbi:MAG: hypothetical protein A3F72_04600 [Bacteroidetes bacterium RIFCSPLOWO2_12_FULL_35_15]|nr:MAG: hypothetical protein A3F72_04600 [Bacteroidetes bacterium RIFCSPLOWO2_12_FULL_35_15]
MNSLLMFIWNKSDFASNERNSARCRLKKSERDAPLNGAQKKRTTTYNINNNYKKNTYNK